MIKAGSRDDGEMGDGGAIVGWCRGDGAGYAAILGIQKIRRSAATSSAGDKKIVRWGRRRRLRRPRAKWRRRRQRRHPGRRGGGGVGAVVRAWERARWRRRCPSSAGNQQPPVVSRFAFFLLSIVNHDMTGLTECAFSRISTAEKEIA